MYIDRDENGNIVAKYARKQREDQEYLEGAELHVSTQKQIADLEASVTPRRLREAVLTNEGSAWLTEVDNQIAALRSTL